MFALRNQVLFSGSVDLASAATSGTFDVPLGAEGPRDGEQVLVTVKNPGAIDITVKIGNMLPLGGENSELAALVDEYTVSAGTIVSKVVTAFPMGDEGRLTFGKAAGTAVSPHVEVRRA